MGFFSDIFKPNPKNYIDDLTLEPCAYCGNTDKYNLRIDNAFSSYYIWCSTCQASSPYFIEGKRKCVMEWNRVMKRT